MPVMAPQTINEKYAALADLYSRIEQIAKELGGAADSVIVPVSHMIATVLDPRSEDVPALRVKMPNGFRVEFAPSGPLSTPYVLSVRVRRAHHGVPKSDCLFNFLSDGWHLTQTLLSEDEIRKCLTPEGPLPAVY